MFTKIVQHDKKGLQDLKWVSLVGRALATGVRGVIEEVLLIHTSFQPVDLADEDLRRASSSQSETYQHRCGFKDSQKPAYNDSHRDDAPIYSCI